MGSLVLLLLFWQSAGPVDIGPATAALRENRFKAALELTRGLLVENAKDARIWTLQGLARKGLGEQAEALKNFRHAVTLAPGYLPALKAEAEIEYATHDPECIRTLKYISALEPRNPVIHAMLGALAYRQNDCEAAVTNYGLSETLIASQTLALTEYAECLFRTGQKTKAVGVFAKVVGLDSVSWQARYNLALADISTDHAADALAVLQPALASQEPRILDVASSVYERLGDTPHAVDCLRQAIVLDPARTELYLHFADLSFAHNSFQAGIDMLNAGLRKLPASAPIYLARGVLHVQTAGYAEAESDFAKAAALDPSQTFSSVAQGLTQLQRSDLDGALATVQAQLKKTPDDAYLCYTKAEILRQKGVEPGTADFAEAVAAAEKAVRGRSGFPLAKDLLGTFYLQQRNLDAAIRLFASVIESEPDNESALYHLIVATRKKGGTGALPELMKRLVVAKAANRKKDELVTRYSFVTAGAAAQSQ